MKVDRSQFIAKIPNATINTHNAAPSTLDCDCDFWGTEESHYRFVNIRDEAGQAKKRPNGKFQKEKRLMGQPHIKWDGPFVRVRVDEEQSMWFKHWPVAVELAAHGKLEDPKLMDWVREEGIFRFETDQVILKNGDKPTRLVQFMVKLGILAWQGNELVVATDSKDAQTAVAEMSMTEVVTSALQEVLAPETEETEEETKELEPVLN